MSGGTGLVWQRVVWLRLAWLRVAAIEARRSSAGAAAVLVASAGGAMLAVHPDLWAGHWAGLASFARGGLVLVLPLVTALAAWHAGRAARCGATELLSSTGRPPLALVALPFGVLTATAVLGLAVPGAVAAVLIGRVGAFGTAWWWLQLVVVVPAVGVAVAVGLLVGRWLTWRVLPAPLPLAGYGLLVLADTGGPLVATWLSPLRVADADQLVPVRGALAQLAWFGGVAVTVLALAAFRPGSSGRLTTSFVQVAPAVAVGVVLAASGLVALGGLPEKAAFPGDPRALEAVCDDGRPQVCLARVDAFLLDDVARRLGPVATRLASVPGGPQRAVQWAPPVLGGRAPSEPVVSIPWHLPATVGGRVLEDSRHGSLVDAAVQHAVGWGRCTENLVDGAPRGSRLSVQWLVAAWVLDGDEPPLSVDDVALPGLRARLTAAPAQWQREWVGDALRLLQRCDTDGPLDALLARLGAR